jgi:hypothetical protein
MRLQRTRNFALFNLAVDSKPGSRDLERCPVRDVTDGDNVAARAVVTR